LSDGGHAGVPSVLRVQRFNADWTPRWEPRGIAVASDGAFTVHMISDGAGGAVIPFTLLDELKLTHLDGSIPPADCPQAEDGTDCVPWPGADCPGLPELVGDWLRAPRTRRKGGQMTAKLRVENRGHVDSGTFTVEFRITSDPCDLTTSSLRLIKTVTNLKPGQKKSFALRIDEADAIAPDARAVAIIDSLNQADECLECDNKMSVDLPAQD
jgi:hypothetical protein